MMSGEAWLYLLAVLINAVNLFLQVFFTIMYSDLEWFVAPFIPYPLPILCLFLLVSRCVRLANRWGNIVITLTLSIFATVSTRTLSLKLRFMAF
jgi:hypothetical protein